MNLARSSLYYRPKAKDPDRMKAEADLRDRIETICLGFPRYGYRRVPGQPHIDKHRLRRQCYSTSAKVKAQKHTSFLCFA